MKHASNQNRKLLRSSIAAEAARIMTEQGIRDCHIAKLKALDRLGLPADCALPRNSEIEQALREYQRLFLSDTQPQLLRKLRASALQALQFFEQFEPRLVGAVLDGSADEFSAVCLHLYADEANSVAFFLDENRIPYQTQTRRMRLDVHSDLHAPVYEFSADGVAIDITVLPINILRQAPLDRFSEKPMKRASIKALREMIASEAQKKLGA